MADALDWLFAGAIIFVVIGGPALALVWLLTPDDDDPRHGV